MQKCYNCGKEVDDNVLICPDCGALVKRYGRPESAQPEQEADPFPRETAFDTQPQPRGAVWQQEDGKLKFSGYVTFWLVLCAIWFGYSLLGFGSLLLVYRFREFYLTAMQQFEELQDFVQLIQALIDSVSAFPVYYIAVALLAAAEFVCTVWFLASKRKLAFYILAAAAVLQMAQMMIFGSGVRSLFHIVGPFVTWFLLRKSWHVLR